MDMTLRKIPDDVHRAFKVYAEKKGSNIKAEIIRLMEEAVSAKVASKK